MPIVTSRTRENGKITFNYEKCTSCALCVKVCKDFSIRMENGYPVESGQPLFGCIACGHCMAVCPTDAIMVSGRELSVDDLIKLPSKSDKTEYDALLSLMKGRRSIRDFKEKDVDDDTVQKIINAALTSPMGLPPSDVSLLVFNGKEKVREFSFDVIAHFKKIKWIFSKRWIWMWRLFGKEAFELMNSFGKPLTDFMVESGQKGENWLLYDAPLAMYFMASPYSDPVDPIIPATYAMLAAESLGLGSCMIGSIHPMIRYGAKDLKAKWKIPTKSPAGIIVVFGYSKYKFTKGIKRSFANITHYS